jgi:hypothetical protein
LDDKPLASGEAASELIAPENCEPFCSSATRLLFGVAELKNVFQLVVISETVLAEPPPLAAGLEAAADAGADDDAAAGGALEDEEELALLEQADIAVTSTRPSAGAR